MILTPKYQKMLLKLDELELMFIWCVTILLALKEKGRLAEAVQVLEELENKQENA